jgi:lipoprotein-releasing system ATP-binding protein
MNNIPAGRDGEGEILIRVEKIVKNYISGAETLHILKGVSVEIKRGIAAAVSGQSGSGKSTFLNILGGLDRADSGRVVVGGTEITALSERELSEYRSRRVGFIFQFHYLLKDFTALEKARTLLADVRLDDRIGHYPSQLSGGERQRVAVARSMVNDPDVILADEPTGNLDPDNSAMVAELLYAGAEKWGKTLIVVTHDEKVAARAAVRCVLDHGFLAEGPGGVSA